MNLLKQELITATLFPVAFVLALVGFWVRPAGPRTALQILALLLLIGASWSAVCGMNRCRRMLESK